MKATRKHLHIGELAKLVGVSVKTVRHYHKIGLLPKPERSESGYRLYTLDYLLTLRTIRQLRDIGLSLPQIQAILSQPYFEEKLRDTLQNMVEEIDVDILDLQTRRDRIRQMLAQTKLEPDTLQNSSSLYVEQVSEQLGHLLPNLDESLLAQETALEQMLSQYNWSDELPEIFAETITYIQKNPEEYQQFVVEMQAIWPTLQSPQTDDEWLQQTAQRLVDQHYPLLGAWLNPGQASGISPVFQNVMGAMISDVISENQHRFYDHLLDACTRKKDARSAT